MKKTLSAILVAAFLALALAGGAWAQSQTTPSQKPSGGRVETALLDGLIYVLRSQVAKTGGKLKVDYDRISMEKGVLRVDNLRVTLVKGHKRSTLGALRLVIRGMKLGMQGKPTVKLSFTLHNLSGEPEPGTKLSVDLIRAKGLNLGDKVVELDKGLIKGLVVNSKDGNMRWQRLELADISFRQKRSLRLGHFRLNAVRFWSLMVPSVRLGEVYLSGLNMPDFERPDLMRIAAAGILNLTVGKPGREMGKLAKLSLVNHNKGDLISGTLELRGLSLDPTRLPLSPKTIKEVISWLGRKPSMDLKISADYAQSREMVTVHDWLMKAQGLGSLRLKGQFSGIPRQAAMSGQKAGEKIKLHRLWVRYTDQSLAKRIISQQAAKKGQGYQAYVASLERQLITQAKKHKSPHFDQLVQALIQFLREPRSITIMCLPDRPVRLQELEALGPARGMARLNLKAKAK